MGLPSIPIKGKGGISKYMEVSKSGNSLEPYRFVVENYNKELSEPPFLGYLTRTISTFTLAQPTVKSTISTLYYTAVLNEGHGLSINDECVIIDATGGWSTLITIKAINGNTITVDRPWDYAFPITSTCLKLDRNLAVDGSVTPVIFSLAGPPTPVYIWGLKIYIVCTGQPDDGIFGDLPKLANGLCLRVMDGFDKNIGSPKTNGELRAFCDTEMPYSDKGPSSKYAVNIFIKNKELWGWANKLEFGSYLQAIVQDDLSTLVGLYISAMGHY